MLHRYHAEAPASHILRVWEGYLWQQLHEVQGVAWTSRQQLPDLPGSMTARAARRAAPSAGNAAHASRRHCIGTVWCLRIAEQLEGAHAEQLLQHDQRGRALAARQIQLVVLCMM